MIVTWHVMVKQQRIYTVRGQEPASIKPAYPLMLPTKNNHAILKFVLRTLRKENGWLLTHTNMDLSFVTKKIEKVLLDTSMNRGILDMSAKSYQPNCKKPIKPWKNSLNL